MSIKYSPFLAVIFILAAFSISNGEIDASFNLGGGYNGNLFNDSLASEDSYSNISGNIDYYPSSSVQLSAFGQYSVYKTNNDLSNIFGGGSIKVIPTGKTSPVSVIFSGEMSYQEFGNLYNLYNQNSFSTDALILYQIAPKININSRVSYAAVSYFNSDYGSRNGLALSGGINFTPFGSNSFNFMTNYYMGRYDQMPSDLDSFPGGRSNRTENYDSYSLTDISLRYSRPIGERTGVSVSFGQRYIRYDESFVTADFDVDNLSPLSDLWDGPSGSVFIKHIFPHQFKLALKGSYAEKSYIETTEQSPDEIVSDQENLRSDSFASFLVSLSRPITIGTGNILTPTLSVSYLSNSSTYDLYDYSGISASLSMNIRF